MSGSTSPKKRHQPVTSEKPIDAPTKYDDVESEYDGEGPVEEGSKIAVRREKNRIKQRNLRQRRADHVSTLEESVINLERRLSKSQKELSNAEKRGEGLDAWVRELEVVLFRNGFGEEVDRLRKMCGAKRKDGLDVLARVAGVGLGFGVGMGMGQGEAREVPYPTPTTPWDETHQDYTSSQPRRYEPELIPHSDTNGGGPSNSKAIKRKRSDNDIPFSECSPPHAPQSSRPSLNGPISYNWSISCPQDGYSRTPHASTSTWPHLQHQHQHLPPRRPSCNTHISTPPLPQYSSRAEWHSERPRKLFHPIPKAHTSRPEIPLPPQQQHSPYPPDSFAFTSYRRPPTNITNDPRPSSTHSTSSNNTITHPTPDPSRPTSNPTTIPQPRPRRPTMLPLPPTSSSLSRHDPSRPKTAPSDNKSTGPAFGQQPMFTPPSHATTPPSAFGVTPSPRTMRISDLLSPQGSHDLNTPILERGYSVPESTSAPMSRVGSVESIGFDDRIAINRAGHVEQRGKDDSPGSEMAVFIDSKSRRLSTEFERNGIQYTHALQGSTNSFEGYNNPNPLEYALTAQPLPATRVSTRQPHPSIQIAKQILLSHYPNPLPTPLPAFPTLNPGEQQIILLALHHLSPPEVIRQWSDRQLSNLPPDLAKVILQYTFSTDPKPDGRLLAFDIAILKARVIRILNTQDKDKYRGDGVVKEEGDVVVKGEREGDGIGRVGVFDLTEFLNDVLTEGLIFGITLDSESWEMSDGFWDRWEGWFPRGRGFCGGLKGKRREGGYEGVMLGEIILGVERIDGRRVGGVQE